MTDRRLTPRARVAAATIVAVVAVGVLEWYAFTRGNELSHEQPAAKLGAGPFVGAWDLRLTALVIPVVVVAAGTIAMLPSFVARTSTWRAIAATTTVAIGFVIALAATDGWSALIKPVTDKSEYWAGLAKARPAADYLRTFLARQKFYSVHVRGHPPGFTLVLIAFRAIGLGSAWLAASLSYLGVGLAVAAVGFTVLRIAGADVMRRALPFLAIAPFAVWQGTSADAFFAGVAAVGIALLVIAMTSNSRRVEIIAAAAGGVVLGASCLLTFGTPTLAPLVAALAWKTRRARWILAAVAGAAVVIGLFAAYRYWWLTGLSHTRMFYAAGTAKFRPPLYFFFANLAVLAIALGPAALAGLSRMSRLGRGGVFIVAGALVCVLLADASGLSKAETERIWLLYMPWIVVAAAAVATSVPRQRLWLAGQALAAVTLQVVLVSKW